MKCQRCGFPIFDGAAGFAGPQCKCWATYHPAPDAAAVGPGCKPLVPLTEADVRRIVREELATAKSQADPVIVMKKAERDSLSPEAHGLLREALRAATQEQKP